MYGESPERNYEELLDKLSGIEEDKVWEAFCTIDTARTGQVFAVELKKVLDLIGEEADEK